MKSVVMGMLGLGLLFSPLARGEDGSGLQTSVSVDIVGQANVKSGSGASDSLRVREAEVLLYSPADHLFDGVLNFAAHDEGGIPMVELHEGYLGSTKLIPRSRFRIGQFFLGFGRLNQFHRHDWPFTSPPKVHREFFDAEGLLDTGFEYSVMPRLPFYLELTGGITNGFVYGHDHTAGSRPLLPTHYLRAVTYTSMPWEGGMQIGLNYVGRRGNEGTQRSIVGLDFTAKWTEVRVLKFFLQSEVWYRSLTPAGGTTEKAIGFYVFPQYNIADTFFAGLRFDYYSVLNQVDAFGTGMKNVELNFVPQISYKPSEFVTVRLSYNNKPEFIGSNPTRSSQYVELQSVFLLGAHPAHDF